MAIRRARTGTSGAGIGVDNRGGPVIDPTDNVHDIVEASERRQDDLREAERRYNDLRAEHSTEIRVLRAEHQREMDQKESSRIDSIRQVDREEGMKTAAAAQAAIATLANQTSVLAETLRTQVATTAQAAESRRALDAAETNKRLSALELTSSEGKGKQTIADPQLAQALQELAAITRNQAAGTGKSEGATNMWGYVVAGVTLLILVITFWSRSQPIPQPVYQQQPIYQQPPAATTTISKAQP